MNALDVFAAARPDVEVDERVLADIAAHVFDGSPRRSSTAGRWMLLAVAAVLVALVAGLALVVGRSGGTAPADTVPSAIPDATVPATLPLGELLSMLPGDSDGQEFYGFITATGLPGTHSLVLSRPQADGSYTSTVVVSRGPRDTLWFDTTRVGPGSAVEVSEFRADGRAWTLTDFSTELLAQTDLGDGTALRVQTQVVDAGADSAAVLEVAAAVRVGANDAVVVDPPPSDLEVVGSWAPGDWLTRVLNVSGSSGEGMSVRTHAVSDPTLAFRLGTYDLRPVLVRGRSGYASTQPFARIMWEERPAQWVEVVSYAADTTADDLVAFAASLQVVAAEEWDARVRMPEGMGGTPATTAPTPIESLPVPGTVAPTATIAPQTAPPGTVLVGNAAQVGGLAGEQARSLELQGAEVLEPANATVPGGVALATTRVFARPGADPLADWVAGELGVELVEPIEALDGIVIDGDVESADVVVVLGLDALTPGLAEDVSLVIGDSVTLGAAGVLSERGYIVNAEVIRQLVDMVPVIADLVDAVDPSILVIQLGTNGPFGAGDLDALLDVVSDVPNVVVVNVHADRSWAATNNVLIAEHDRPGDNVIVLDWDAFAEQCPGECFVSDGLHLTQTGAEFFADRLGDITGA